MRFILALCPSMYISILPPPLPLGGVRLTNAEKFATLFLPFSTFSSPIAVIQSHCHRDMQIVVDIL